MKNEQSIAELESTDELEDREPGFFYGDMPPIRDFSEAVSGLPPWEAIQVLRARQAEKRGKTSSDMPTRDSKGTKADVDTLMERRSFGTGKRQGGGWVYQRGEHDRVLTVRFAGEVVSDSTMTYADGYQEGEPETRNGWKGLWSFA